MSSAEISLRRYNHLARTRRRLEVFYDELEEFQSSDSKGIVHFYNELIPDVKIWLDSLKPIDEILNEIKKVPEYHKISDAIKDSQKNRSLENMTKIARAIRMNMYPVLNAVYEIGLKYKPEITPELKLVGLALIRRYREIEKEIVGKLKTSGSKPGTMEMERLWLDNYFDLYKKLLSIHKDMKTIPGIEGNPTYDYIDDVFIEIGLTANRDKPGYYESKIVNLSKILDIEEGLISWVKKEIGVRFEFQLPENFEDIMKKFEELNRLAMEKDITIADREREIKRLRILVAVSQLPAAVGQQSEITGQTIGVTKGVEADVRVVPKHTKELETLEKLYMRLTSSGFTKGQAATIGGIMKSVFTNVGRVLQIDLDTKLEKSMNQVLKELYDTNLNLTEENKEFLKTTTEIVKGLDDLKGYEQLDEILEEVIRIYALKLNSFIERQRENRSIDS